MSLYLAVLIQDIKLFSKVRWKKRESQALKYSYKTLETLIKHNPSTKNYNSVEFYYKQGYIVLSLHHQNKIRWLK